MKILIACLFLIFIMSCSRQITNCELKPDVDIKITKPTVKEVQENIVPKATLGCSF